ncbi:STAS domain-containing protein [Streptomyces nigra]|uniref:STAS domain-containing protein n=1 Tax=Streptomyces nigra TaxID=1827580 RepID=UPI003CC5E66E
MRFFRLRRSGWTGVRSAPDHRVVRLCGTLDAGKAEATGQRLVRLIKAGPGVLEVDLAGVEYLSPDGCETLFTALHAARAHGTKLIVTRTRTHGHDQSCIRSASLAPCPPRPRMTGDRSAPTAPP